MAADTRWDGECARTDLLQHCSFNGNLHVPTVEQGSSVATGYERGYRFNRVMKFEVILSRSDYARGISQVPPSVDNDITVRIV